MHQVEVLFLFQKQGGSAVIKSLPRVVTKCLKTLIELVTSSIVLFYLVIRHTFLASSEIYIVIFDNLPIAEMMKEINFFVAHISFSRVFCINYKMYDLGIASLF